MHLHRLGSTDQGTALQMKDLGILVDRELNVSQHCTLVAIKANHMLDYISDSVVSRARAVVISLFSAEAGSWRTVSMGAHQCSNHRGILN